MSFRCAKCNDVASKGQMVVQQTRNKEYLNARQDEFGRPLQADVSYGTEIVREQRECFKCAGVSE